MGVMKRMMEDHEAKWETGIWTALEAGVLGQCQFHDDAIYEGSEDITEAYKLGNAKFTSGELSGVFDNRREMTDTIKEVVDHPAEECPFCAKFRDED